MNLLTEWKYSVMFDVFYFQCAAVSIDLFSDLIAIKFFFIHREKKWKQ